MSEFAKVTIITAVGARSCMSANRRWVRSSATSSLRRGSMRCVSGRSSSGGRRMRSRSSRGHGPVRGEQRRGRLGFKELVAEVGLGHVGSSSR